MEGKHMKKAIAVIALLLLVACGDENIIVADDDATYPNLVLTVINSTQIDLEWDATPYGAQWYRIDAYYNGTSSSTGQRPGARHEKNRYSWTWAFANTEHCFTITDYDYDGSSLFTCDPVCATTPPN
jgi:hypothetical protein